MICARCITCRCAQARLQQQFSGLRAELETLARQKGSGRACMCPHSTRPRITGTRRKGESAKKGCGHSRCARHITHHARGLHQARRFAATHDFSDESDDDFPDDLPGDADDAALADAPDPAPEGQ